MTSPKDNSETIHDNPTGWVSRHIAEYVETEGREANAGAVSTRSSSSPRGVKQESSAAPPSSTESTGPTTW
jgi:hypothetical protein